jgi:hypothetical protein
MVHDFRLIPKGQFLRGLRVGKGGGCARFPDAAIQRPRGPRPQTQNPGRGAKSFSREVRGSRSEIHPVPFSVSRQVIVGFNARRQLPAPVRGCLLVPMAGLSRREFKRRVNTRRRLLLRSPGTKARCIVATFSVSVSPPFAPGRFTRPSALSDTGFEVAVPKEKKPNVSHGDAI